ncbi:hypothetical protein TEA_018291 [Camellia sinensis var. sinensis]|uniref:PPM-type phosphatase domain-containing protein n=1 Tax=Camellia sinensis var. sinensis TaxID=542762 RepID=A0A4S4EIE0_CAMSN|nr:hypothetical protein TEA_018291 [Camellia sinensis var. sinensis]
MIDGCDSGRGNQGEPRIPVRAWCQQRGKAGCTTSKTGKPSGFCSSTSRRAESVVYEAVLDGNKVAVKKPILSTSDHIDKFHKELQMLCELLTGVVPYTDLRAEAQAHTVLEMNYTEQQLTAAVVSEGLRPALAGHSSSAPTGFLKRVEEDEKEKALVEPSIPLGDEGIPSLLAYQKSISWFTEGENLSKRSCLAADSGVTRSISDDDPKPAVTAEPEITETILFVEDEYLVRFWLAMALGCYEQRRDCIIKDTMKEPRMCSKRLATEAAERGSKDNIIVIVIFLHPVSTAERIY